MPTLAAANTRHWYMYGKPVKREHDDEWLRNLAYEICTGEIFTSDMIPRHDIQLMQVVFLPVLFGDHEEFREKGISMMYEYYREAGPRGVNGMPMFFSMRVLNFIDHARLEDLMREVARSLEKVRHST